MSESYESGPSGETDSPISRHEDLPPKTGAEEHRPGADDVVDTGVVDAGMEGEGDIGRDAEGGMLGEG